ncbi:hypothetical protein GYMLUDRAFT_252646 [Collybiopsis luxurians FD-317 M1]|uniref:Uncharacterized protein n=1 Tax=Collybiopsis luxurians FD-317 M1 TaxID=944289 RepID=A0A0D0C7M9_9AGAR|nr:hypothetical protein GYMLUDRAFT_252646 [Collybiopsis luxurians FD-317 M1]
MPWKLMQPPHVALPKSITASWLGNATVVDPELIFMGIKGQGTFCTAAATSSTPELSTSTIAAATSAPPSFTADFAQILQQLNANQQVLAAQIAELCQNF